MILCRTATPARGPACRFPTFSCSGQASFTPQASGGLRPRFEALRRLSARALKKVHEGGDSQDGSFLDQRVFFTRICRTGSKIVHKVSPAQRKIAAPEIVWNRLPIETEWRRYKNRTA
jgi:hypothetical protein